MTRVGAWLSLVLLAACSAGVVEPADDDDGSGATGAGANGGGGAGGADLCATDCSAITPPDCYVSVCNDGQHPGPVGVCVVVAAAAGTPCEDGFFCTVGDTCQAGTCTGGPPNDCGSTPGPCESVTCNEATKACTSQPAGNGASCTPTSLCQVGGICSNGNCVGQPKDCFFAPVPDDCHVAECNPQNGMCEPVPGNQGQICTDPTDLCTVGKTCNAGACTGGQPKNCTALTQGCNLGVCDAGTGQCVAQTVPNGAQCDDLNACTVGEICNNGSCAGGTAITACLNGDGCCPAGCTDVDDDDCGNDLLIVYAVPSASYATDVQAKLQSFGVFPVVDLFNAQLATPTLSQLVAYDVLLVFSDSQFQNPVGLGNVIADYYDLGGRVVTAPFSQCSSIALAGRWADPAQGYAFIATAGQTQPSDSLGTVLEPSSPLMTGVSQLSAPSAYRCPGAVINGGIVVAQWGVGPHPLVVRGVVQGRPRVDLNFYPPSSAVNGSFWSGDGAALLRNALLFK
jgi:hypothetical protein